MDYKTLRLVSWRLVISNCALLAVMTKRKYASVSMPLRLARPIKL